MTANIKNQIIEENLINQMEDILRMIGLSEAEIAKHQEILLKKLFISITDDLNKLSVFKDKEPFPIDLKSIDDFFEYYEKYVDKKVIKNIIIENTQKIYSEYLDPIVKELK